VLILTHRELITEIFTPLLKITDLIVRNSMRNHQDGILRTRGYPRKKESSRVRLGVVHLAINYIETSEEETGRKKKEQDRNGDEHLTANHHPLHRHPHLLPESLGKPSHRLWMCSQE